MSGRETGTAVAVSLDVDTDGIHVETRTGVVAEDRILIPHERVDSVHVRRDGTYTLVVETGPTTYRMTNVASDRSAIREALDYVREQSGLAERSTREEGQTPKDTAPTTDGDDTGGDATKTEMDEWVWGSTPDSD